MADEPLTRNVHDVDVHEVAPDEHDSYYDDREPAHHPEGAATEGSASGEDFQAQHHSHKIPTRQERRHGQGMGGVRRAGETWKVGTN